MSDHAERLNAWHLDLAILADAIEHVLTGIEEPQGLSATAHVLKNRLLELVENCPFPDLKIRPVVDPDFDLDDFDGSLPADTVGVPAELLTGGRDD